MDSVSEMAFLILKKISMAPRIANAKTISQIQPGREYGDTRASQHHNTPCHSQVRNLITCSLTSGTIIKIIPAMTADITPFLTDTIDCLFMTPYRGQPPSFPYRYPAQYREADLCSPIAEPPHPYPPTISPNNPSVSSSSARMSARISSSVRIGFGL